MSYTYKKPTLFQAFIPIIFLVVALFINVRIFGDASLDGSNQIILILSAAVAALVALRLKMPWEAMQDGVVKSISSAMASILILLLIGSLAGTWLLSGIVPAMIYYGLQILNPTIFLFAACIVCSIVSVATGSSWTTAATVGIALIGIGKALGLHEGMVAGAVLSGAYFGDKMSPLSDTTNLAPAMAGTDLFTHIRYMSLTTVPSITIALVVFLILGFTGSANGEVNQTEEILTAISGQFNINGALFIVPIVVVILIVKKMPALPAILIGILLGALFALVFQPEVVRTVADWDGTASEQTFVGIMKSMYGDIAIVTGNEIVDELLSSGGMYGMLGTVWLILSAMIFGGIMEASGLLKRIAEAVISGINSIGSLVASTVGTCVFFNITASDQYLAIVVPGRMYADIYKEKGLAPENLSRTLEDSGTVTSVLVPWNTCGAYHSNVLGVSTFAYAPFAIFNYISPLMSIIFAYFKIKIKMREEAKTEMD
ncbi:Na+/H+ antiporter NhaC [Roseivirga pacifica]|uniref:Na+/H+ antiporter NhaC n=1 Tax=Roseivirga pacifica TaxID=1267423 RepID=UPI0020957FE4|nr:Na+/H+ antiporter NhaC [Roseivirga pacifica]MCO6357729.1 Na+/H+ antiporter NhaC [Roseivirga pacifica]MCO6365982.1 Na+/H+ antiporter NhaC [Roseivirga pacifica]MCO6371310.1 Na+/H+ antiporter NhaC [Roseivirga pacifica]MCO6375519.1 Na+/H+ antiporter NhaC [Roseivirga pacifica]MCO6378688.1 Na+/H+ antiporter NhaC [Roseivirga pacifica]